jgi:hypothetical protein
MNHLSLMICFGKVDDIEFNMEFLAQLESI